LVDLHPERPLPLGHADDDAHDVRAVGMAKPEKGNSYFFQSSLIGNNWKAGIFWPWRTNMTTAFPAPPLDWAFSAVCKWRDKIERFLP
jgi:hypothetical protein